MRGQQLVYIVFIMAVNKQVLDHLEHCLEDNPDTDSLTLEFMFISDLLPYMNLLSQFSNLKSLSLHGNSIKQLPIDMSSLSSLEQLDLSNNLIKDVQLAAVSLSTLPRLKKLSFPVKKEKQKIVIQKLKKLVSLNNVKVIREFVNRPPPMKYMNEKQFQKMKLQFNRHYQKILMFENSYLQDKPTSSNQQKFHIQMNSIISDAFAKLNEKEGQISESLELIIYNMTRYEIFQIIKNQAINIAMDIYGEVGKFLRDVNDDQDKIWKSVVEKSLNLCRFEYEIQAIEKEKQANSKAGLKLEDRLVNKNSKLDKEIRRVKKQKEELMGEVNRLESENRQYMEALVKYAKGDRKTISAFTSNFHAPAANFVKTSHQFHNSGQANISGGNASHSFKSRQGSRHIPKEQPSANFNSTGRNLTLKQLKDTIEEIYESKLKYDQKNFDGKLARQTMHQYLFTYLNQKYGLKNLTIEAATSIVSGIQAYSPEDNDVAVFGKILRNEVDQQFRNVQSQLKSTIKSLLKMHIKNQHPYKSTAEIDALYKEKTHSEISSEEVQDIVKYLYNKIDSDRILQKMQMLYKLNRPREEPTHRRMHRQDLHHQEKEKKKIKYASFVQTILDFQLKNHERLIRPLVSVFRQRDTDNDGILNEDQFISVIEELCEEASDIIPDLLMIVDPYETKTITFTQMVRLVANYPQNNPILSRYIESEEIIEEEQYE